MVPFTVQRFFFGTYVSNLLQCGLSRLQHDRIYSVLASTKTKTFFISNVREKYVVAQNNTGAKRD